MKNTLLSALILLSPMIVQAADPLEGLAGAMNAITKNLPAEQPRPDKKTTPDAKKEMENHEKRVMSARISAYKSLLKDAIKSTKNSEKKQEFAEHYTNMQSAAYAEYLTKWLRDNVEKIDMTEDDLKPLLNVLTIITLYEDNFTNKFANIKTDVLKKWQSNFQKANNILMQLTNNNAVYMPNRDAISFLLKEGLTTFIDYMKKILVTRE